MAGSGSPFRKTTPRHRNSSYQCYKNGDNLNRTGSPNTRASVVKPGSVRRSLVVVSRMFQCGQKNDTGFSQPNDRACRARAWVPARLPRRDAMAIPAHRERARWRMCFATNVPHQPQAAFAGRLLSAPPQQAGPLRLHLGLKRTERHLDGRAAAETAPNRCRAGIEHRRQQSHRLLLADGQVTTIACHGANPGQRDLNSEVKLVTLPCLLRLDLRKEPERASHAKQVQPNQLQL